MVANDLGEVMWEDAPTTLGRMSPRFEPDRQNREIGYRRTLEMFLSPHKILAVDDSELIHRMYDLTFARYRRAGCEIVHALNGVEAFAALHQHSDVDLIVIDINMPVMNGLAFLEKRRSDEKLRGIPAIIVSTEGMEEDTIRGLQAGAKAYVKKPFKPAELYEIIERVLAAEAGRGSSADDLLALPQRQSPT